MNGFWSAVVGVVVGLSPWMIGFYIAGLGQLRQKARRDREKARA